MLGYNPIIMENVNINDWLEEDDDNIIIYTKSDDPNNITCLKKSYFQSLSLNSMIVKLKVENEVILYMKSKNGKKYINLKQFGINSGVVEFTHFMKLLNETNVIYICPSINYFQGCSYESLINNKNSHSHSKMMLDLDDEKVKCLRDYTYGWDSAMNLLLRNGEEKYRQNPEFLSRLSRYGNNIDEAINNIYRHIEVIDSAFLEASKTEEEIVVYRGVKDNIFYDGVNLGYISTTESITKAFDFSDAISIYEIHIHEGVPFLYLEEITLVKGEREKYYYPVVWLLL